MNLRRRMILLLIFILICPAAQALQAEVTFEGPQPQPPERIVVRLTPEEGNNPMPEGCGDGRSDATVLGSGTAIFPEIEFDQPGVYRYTLRQIPGWEENGVYDAQVYRLTATVSEDQPVEITLHTADGAPTDAARFHNVYHEAASAENSKRPFPILPAAVGIALLVLICRKKVRT